MNDLKPCPFCGGEAHIVALTSMPPKYHIMHACSVFAAKPTDTAEAAIEAWNTRADNCAECARSMGEYADSLCDPLKEQIAELLRCLENDWDIKASWDGLRKFWCIELTDEGVRKRDSNRADENDFAYGNDAEYWHDEYEKLLRAVDVIRDATERTCKRIESPKDDEGRPNLPTCSECGGELTYIEHYCPSCGAKVVE